MRILFFLFLLLLSGIRKEARAQDNYPMEFSDSLRVEYVAHSVTNRPDTFRGDTIFQFHQSGAFVLQHYRNDTTVLLVFVKSKKAYTVFEAGRNTVDASYSCDSVDFDGKGNMELVLHWSNHTSEQYIEGESEQIGTVDLWNLDKCCRLFSFQDEYYYSSRWNVRIPTDSGLATMTEEEHYCENYDVVFGQEQITISCRPECAKLNSITGLPLPRYRKKYGYQLRGDYMVLNVTPAEDGPVVDTMLAVPIPESFPVIHPVRSHVATLNEISARVVDSLEHPLVYILEDKHSIFMMCLPTDSGYVIFNPGIDCYADHLQLERMQFNGTGSEEVVVRWSKGDGVSLWTHGWAEHSAGVQVWDLDKMEILFSFENYASHTSWWQAYEDDTTGILTYEERNVVDSDWEATCSNYSVTIGPGTITIVQVAECPDQEGILYVPGDRTVYRYELTTGGMIRKK